MLGEEALAARVREPDRVQHPVRRLGDARRRVALARQRRDRLRDEAVELPRDLGRGERVEAAGRVKQQQEHRSFDAEALQLAVDLDGAAVARAVAARHRRLPRELRAGAVRGDRVQHRLRPAREHVVPVRDAAP